MLVLRRVLLVTALAVGVIGVAACSSDTPSRSALISSFRRADSQGRRMNEKAAACLADTSIKVLTPAQLHQLANDSAATLPADVQAKWGKALQPCLALDTSGMLAPAGSVPPAGLNPQTGPATGPVGSPSTASS